MSNNYPYYPSTNRPKPPYMEPTTQFMGIKGRPVSSLEEARAISIDFDGSIFYFPDLANHRIYTKQINLDGTASFNVYELAKIPEPRQESYITREEFEQVISQLKASIAAPVGQTSQPQQPQMKF